VAHSRTNRVLLLGRSFMQDSDPKPTSRRSRRPSGCTLPAVRPDERRRRLLEEAAAVGNATARALMFQAPASEEVEYYPGSAWTNMLFPVATPSRPRRRWSPPKASSRSRPPGTSAEPAHPPRVPVPDRLQGRRRPRLRWGQVLHRNPATRHPGGPVLVPDPVRQPDPLHAPDPQRYPRAGSQRYPTPAAKADPDGSTTIHLAPEKPAGVAEGNWIQTVPGKG
jgi:Protein of unknown function (DUF1214)